VKRRSARRLPEVEHGARRIGDHRQRALTGHLDALLEHLAAQLPHLARRDGEVVHVHVDHPRGGLRRALRLRHPTGRPRARVDAGVGAHTGDLHIAQLPVEESAVELAGLSGRVRVQFEVRE
jgi:hypothetical protein